MDKNIETLRPVRAIGIDRLRKNRKIGDYFLDLQEFISKEALDGYMKDKSLLSCRLGAILFIGGYCDDEFMAENRPIVFIQSIIFYFDHGIDTF